MTLRATITPMRRAARVTAKPVRAVEFTPQARDLPFNCGGMVLGDADKSINDGGGELTVEDAQQIAGGILQSEENECSGVGLVLYTTNAEQEAEKAGLAAAGYSVVATFNNPGGEWCQLHAKLINQPARRTRASARRRGVRRASRR